MLRSGLYSRKIRIALAVVLLCGTLPSIVLAQTVTKTTDENTPFAASVTNTCNGDQVEVTGQSQTREEIEDRPDRFRFRSRSHDFGRGPGAPSGFNYQYQDQTENETVSTVRTFILEFQHRQHLIREGRKQETASRGDDMFIRVRSRFRVDNGVIKKDEFQDSGVVCK